MTRSKRPPADAERKRQFRETARELVHVDRVKGRYGEARDTAGAIARALEQAYRMGLEDALAPPGARARRGAADAPGEGGDALEWEMLPPRTRGTFWSICLAALSRSGRTSSPAYLVPVETPRGTLAWHLVVPGEQPYDQVVGGKTIVTLVRLGLLVHAASGPPRVMLTDYGIKTWNRFCERGGQWPDDLIASMPR